MLDSLYSQIKPFIDGFFNISPERADSPPEVMGVSDETIKPRILVLFPRALENISVNEDLIDSFCTDVTTLMKADEQGSLLQQVIDWIREAIVMLLTKYGACPEREKTPFFEIYYETKHLIFEKLGLPSGNQCSEVETVLAKTHDKNRFYCALLFEELDDLVQDSEQGVETAKILNRFKAIKSSVLRIDDVAKRNHVFSSLCDRVISQTVREDNRSQIAADCYGLWTNEFWTSELLMNQNKTLRDEMMKKKFRLIEQGAAAGGWLSQFEFIQWMSYSEYKQYIPALDNKISDKVASYRTFFQMALITDEWIKDAQSCENPTGDMLEYAQGVKDKIDRLKNGEANNHGVANHRFFVQKKCVQQSNMIALTRHIVTNMLNGNNRWCSASPDSRKVKMLNAIIRFLSSDEQNCSEYDESQKKAMLALIRHICDQSRIWNTRFLGYRPQSYIEFNEHVGIKTGVSHQDISACSLTLSALQSLENGDSSVIRDMLAPSRSAIVSS